MNGAQFLVPTLLAGGIDTCFANPGTSEMHFVAALDPIPGMHCVLGLFKGLVSGAADSYARMAGKPAATLFHCGPGLTNALASLHTARRAASPIVNIVGDQATYHRPLDAPLIADTEGWARAVCPASCAPRLWPRQWADSANTRKQALASDHYAFVAPAGRARPVCISRPFSGRPMIASA